MVGWRWLLRDTHVEVETLKALMVAHSYDLREQGTGPFCTRTWMGKLLQLQTVSRWDSEFQMFVFFLGLDGFLD